MSVEERALSGVFLAFQYPVEIPGVGSATFLKTAVNAARKHRGEKEYWTRWSSSSSSRRSGRRSASTTG